MARAASQNLHIARIALKYLRASILYSALHALFCAHKHAVKIALAKSARWHLGVISCYQKKKRDAGAPILGMVRHSRIGAPMDQT